MAPTAPTPLLLLLAAAPIPAPVCGREETPLNCGCGAAATAAHRRPRLTPLALAMPLLGPAAATMLQRGGAVEAPTLRSLWSAAATRRILVAPPLPSQLHNGAPHLLLTSGAPPPRVLARTRGRVRGGGDEAVVGATLPQHRRLPLFRHPLRMNSGGGCGTARVGADAPPPRRLWPHLPPASASGPLLLR